MPFEPVSSCGVVVLLIHSTVWVIHLLLRQWAHRLLFSEFFLCRVKVNVLRFDKPESL